MGRKKISVDADFPQQVLKLVMDAAKAGEKCPSDAEMAKRLRCGRMTISDNLHKLQKAGILVINRIGAFRVARVCATGINTKLPPPPAPRYQRAPGLPRFTGAAPERRQFTVVTRDPCPRCGVRADVGCPHRPKAAPEEVRI